MSCENRVRRFAPLALGSCFDQVHIGLCVDPRTTNTDVTNICISIFQIQQKKSVPSISTQVVVQVYSPSTREVEVGGSGAQQQVQDQPELHQTLP